MKASAARVASSPAMEETVDEQAGMQAGDIRSKMFEQRDLSLVKKGLMAELKASGPLMMRDQIHMTLATLSDIDVDIMLLAGGTPMTVAPEDCDIGEWSAWTETNISRLRMFRDSLGNTSWDVCPTSVNGVIDVLLGGSQGCGGPRGGPRRTGDERG